MLGSRLHYDLASTEYGVPYVLIYPHPMDKQGFLQDQVW